MPSRNDAIEALYAAKAGELRHAVGRAVSLPEDLIDDACSYAWCQLVACERVAVEDASFGWLYVVAIRYGYRLSHLARREPACELPEDSLVAPDTWSAVERHLDHEQRCDLLARISGRRRRLVLLHAAGFTYDEISRITGDTLRTVERQLLRGKRALRRAAVAADVTERSR